MWYRLIKTNVGKLDATEICAYVLKNSKIQYDCKKCFLSGNEEY